MFMGAGEWRRASNKGSIHNPADGAGCDCAVRVCHTRGIVQSGSLSGFQHASARNKSPLQGVSEFRIRDSTKPGTSSPCEQRPTGTCAYLQGWSENLGIPWWFFGELVHRRSFSTLTICRNHHRFQSRNFLLQHQRTSSLQQQRRGQGKRQRQHQP